MKIAMPVSQNRLSTVFDAADELVVLETKEGALHAASRLSLKGANVIAKAALLKSSDVQVLICGALPRPMEYMFEAAGIRTIPFIRGSVDAVFAAFQEGRLDDHVFAMPGCRRRHGQNARRTCYRHGKK